MSFIKDSKDLKDFIGKYFYSRVDKKWFLESTWSYKDFSKRVNIVGLEKFVDELFDYFQKGTIKHNTLILSKRIENYKSEYEKEEFI